MVFRMLSIIGICLAALLVIYRFRRPRSGDRIDLVTRQPVASRASVAC